LELEQRRLLFHLIVKVIGVEVTADVPPPYMPPAVPGLVTVTGAGPEFAIAVDGIMVVSLVELTKVVVSFAPLKFITAPALKLVPSTSRVKAGPPEFALLGTSWAMTGVEAGTGGVFECEP
jgi:hypothetical protein